MNRRAKKTDHGKYQRIRVVQKWSVSPLAILDQCLRRESSRIVGVSHTATRYDTGRMIIHT